MGDIDRQTVRDIARIVVEEAMERIDERIDEKIRLHRLLCVRRQLTTLAGVAFGAGGLGTLVAMALLRLAA